MSNRPGVLLEPEEAPPLPDGGSSLAAVAAGGRIGKRWVHHDPVHAGPVLLEDPQILGIEPSHRRVRKHQPQDARAGLLQLVEIETRPAGSPQLEGQEPVAGRGLQDFVLGTELGELHHRRADSGRGGELLPSFLTAGLEPVGEDLSREALQRSPLEVSTARLKVLQDRQKHLQTLLRPQREPDFTDPAGQARRVFEALAELPLQEARLHHAALWPCVVERIDCYPVYENRSGEVMEISWNDKGWAELLRKAQALWPEDQLVPG